ncbi:hypothetical protein [Salinisphaera sp. G21_0]|uniref:hypothetical protein n=1 Tax=Salinisphaera sp. G21_0 TaxID=2821094 RepID=UPI001ADA7215|nr:hypothetical protein [Salinisphaera sp. G21_0]MBO9484271.1 hypothetical protein [Salinisphaera sp. G21_0]
MARETENSEQGAQQSIGLVIVLNVFKPAQLDRGRWHHTVISIALVIFEGCLLIDH